MTRFRRFAGSVALAALLATSATPAMAQRGGWGGGRHHDRHRGGGDGLLAGILILGGVAAIASAASSNRDRQQREDYPVPDAFPEDAEPVLDVPDDSARDDVYRSPVRIGTEDQAVDACAIAAEQDGGRDGRTAQVRDVDRVDAVGGGWNVSGRVELRRGYRDPSRQTEDFTCTVRGGQVASVRLTGGEGLR